MRQEKDVAVEIEEMDLRSLGEHAESFRQMLKKYQEVFVGSSHNDCQSHKNLLIFLQHLSEAFCMFPKCPSGTSGHMMIMPDPPQVPPQPEVPPQVDQDMIIMWPDVPIPQKPPDISSASVGSFLILSESL